MRSSDLRRDDRGFALLSVIAVVGALLVAGIAAVRMTRTELRGTADSVAQRKAFYVAEGGVQRAMARLSQDRTTAASSTAYTFSESNRALGSGSYSVTVVQDPLFPTDARRKLITAVGTVDGQQSTVVNHAVVQTQPASTICFTDEGTCKFQAAAAISTDMFAGDVFSNHDVKIEAAAGVGVRGSGNVYARNRFSDGGLTLLNWTLVGNVLSRLNANLFAGTSYSPSGLLGADLHLLGTTPYGVHFANGPNTFFGAWGINSPNGHGVVQTIAKRPFPQVDWEALRADPRAILVNAENVPFGSWDAASSTWVVASLLSPPVDGDVIYYVEGNAHLVSLQLVKGARMTIAARGWLATESISVLNVGLLPSSSQTVRLIAREGNTIGLRLLGYSPLALEDTLNAISPALGMAAGIGLNVGGVLTTQNRIFAYSETTDVWAKVSTLLAASTNNRIGMVAKRNATLAYTGSILSSMKPY